MIGAIMGLILILGAGGAATVFILRRRRAVAGPGAGRAGANTAPTSYSVANNVDDDATEAGIASTAIA